MGDVQLLGRVTYEGFAKAGRRCATPRFGGKMNAMPRVVSTTLTETSCENSDVAILTFAR